MQCGIYLENMEKSNLEHKPLLLIIDDEQAICDSCATVFIKDGYRTSRAMDGKTGLEKVQQLKPDIVFIDLKMPGMSGMKVLKEIRKIDPNIVPIIITGYATIESAVESMKLGSFDYLPKPFTPDELRAITKRGLKRRKLLLETELLRKEKEMMQEKFISMVSHQLRTPLVAVQEYLEVILGGMAGKVAGEQKHMLERIQIRISELLSLINDWLSFSRIDESEISQKFKAVAITTLLEELLNFMQPVAQRKRIALVGAYCDTPLLVNGDKESLRELFINLISNGINYNRQGGKVKLTLKEENSNIVIKISDTGIGIPSQDIPFIFDEFYRIKSKEVQSIPGTGLGLSIAKRIVEAHKGTINVESKLGEGTTFIVSLSKGGKNG